MRGTTCHGGDVALTALSLMGLSTCGTLEERKACEMGCFDLSRRVWKSNIPSL